MSDYSSNFPTQRPVFSFNANSGKLDSRISYARSSTGTAFSSERHLSSENLLPYSSDLSNASWTKYESTASSGAIGPDGTANASSVLETTANNIHTFYDNFEVVSGVSYTYVAFVKANGRTKVKFQCQAQPTIANVEFDLTAVTSTVLTGTATSHEIVASGGTGWYRCSVTVVAGGTGAGYHQIHISNGSSYSYAGDVTKGIYISGTSVSSTQQLYVSETSGQLHREFAPTLKTSAADTPRFEYAADGQSVAGTAKGLLIESQSSNLATYGSDLTNAVWNPLSATAANAAIGPDGTLSAAKLTSGTGSGIYPRFRRLAFLSTSKTQTFSVYVKPLEYSYLNISQDGHSTQMVHYNLTGSGSISSSAGCSGTVEQCGNGWFRVSFTHTNATSSTNLAIVMQSTATYSGETGNGFDGMLFASAQLEDAASASSFISTSSSQVSRAADSCSVDLAQTSYRGGPVSIVAEIPAGAGEGYIPYLFTLSGGDQNFYAFKNTTTASASDDWRYQVGGTGTTVSGSAGSDKIAIRWDTADVKAQFSTGASSTNSGAVETAFTDLKIGMSPANLYQLNGNFKRFSLYSVALSDTELAALTS